MTLEIAPEVQTALENEAQRHGQTLAAYIAEVLERIAEDAADIDKADRVMANSDPSQRIPWEQVKA